MRALLDTYRLSDDFASENDVVFNAAKSKCLIMKPSRGRNVAFESLPSTPFCIGGKVIEFVNSWPHLGHVLHVNGDDGMDINKIRKALCGEINNVLCYFGNCFETWAHKAVLL